LRYGLIINGLDEGGFLLNSVNFLINFEVV